MNAEVVRISREGSCSARLPNDILLVFQAPSLQELQVGDMLHFVNFDLDATVDVHNVTRDKLFSVLIAANNVHDLRLPVQHGVARTPSKERLHDL
jgi:hypothetical protein